MLPGLRRRPILAAAAGLGMLAGGLARVAGLAGPSAVLFGWCAAVLAHIGPTFVLMQRSTPQSIRRRAEQLDEGEAAVLSASLAAAIASLGAVVWYMASHREPVGPRACGAGPGDHRPVLGLRAPAVRGALRA